MKSDKKSRKSKKSTEGPDTSDLENEGLEKDKEPSEKGEKIDEDMLYKIYFSHNEVQQALYDQEKDQFGELNTLK